ncbi:MAG: response regulator transcription factor [Firmicutes bacterium]|nr:response regulator transcription factor [Bacillota bacterium]
MTIRVMLVEDHAVVRQGMAAILSADSDMEIVGQADSAVEAKNIYDECRPDVVVMDIQLKDGNGLDCCRVLTEEHSCRVLLLSGFINRQMALKAIEAKAAGYILKYENSETIVKAIKTVYQGRSVYASEVSEHLVQLVGNDWKLTRKEHEVLALVGQGMTNKQIAKQLFLSEKTVRNYLSRILRKLDLENRTEAALYWHKQNSGC